MRERQREKEREKERKTEREREKERKRVRVRERERERERERVGGFASGLIDSSIKRHARIMSSKYNYFFFIHLDIILLDIHMS